MTASIRSYPALRYFTRFAAVLIIVLSTGNARPLSAQPPADYYDDVDETNSATLRTTLHDAIDDHTRFPYTDNNTDTWDILNVADEDPNDIGRIIDVYRNESLPKMSGGVGPYNREHTWPNSYGFPDDNTGNYPYTDCHHLFLSDSGYNSSRSNKPYRYCDANCSEKETVFNDGRGGGTGGYPADSNWTEGSFTQGTWETWDGRKGDVARAIFYMDIRYEGGVHGDTGRTEPDLIVTDNESLIDSSNTGDNEDVAYMGMLADLLLWHEQDPVDSREIWRNEIVFANQGNRNPFIDHPEWVACLHSNECDAAIDPPVLGISGGCPGSIDFDITDATPNASVAIISGPNAGSSVVPGGNCAGTDLDLDNPTLRQVLATDGSGNASLQFSLPAGACASVIQVLDLDSCLGSDVVPLP